MNHKLEYEGYEPLLRYALEMGSPYGIQWEKRLKEDDDVKVSLC